VAVSLRYEKGLLISGATRGDGSRGDDITNNVRTVSSIPLRLEQAEMQQSSATRFDAGQMIIPEVLEVRGEIFMPYSEFERLNRKRQETGEPAFANPRNATAGSLKLLDSRGAAARGLHFLGYAVGEVIPSNFATSHTQMFDKLRALSLPMNLHHQNAENIDKVIEICHRWQDKRHELDYQIDGMVVKVDSFFQQQQLGQTSRAPRWCIAYKFAAEQAETIIESITVQVGKTGALTPVANLKPVLLAGTTVRRASLHNFDEITRKDIRQGDAVLIEKAGEIIPQVVEVITEKRSRKSQPFPVPRRCPQCLEPVSKEEDEVYIRCTNPNCAAQLTERLRHFAGRDQMDIEGLGIALIEQLVKTSKVKSIADIYRLNKKELSGMERMGDKSAEKLIRAIDDSKTRSLERVLAGLGILHVGKRAAQVLADEFGSIENIMEADTDTLEKIDEIGPVIAQSINRFFHTCRNRSLIEDLRHLGLTMPGARHQTTSAGLLTGKSICVTGSIEGCSRKEIEEKIKEWGGKFVSSVSKKTDLLVHGENSGSKLAKAEKLGVETISAEEFFKQMKSAD